MMNTEEIIRRRLMDLSNERANILSERKLAEYSKSAHVQKAKKYAKEMLDYDAQLVVLGKEIDFMTELLNKENKEASAE